MAEPLLYDRRILVVEDEYLIARAMQQDLQQAGAIVLGPVPNVAGALALLQTGQEVDAAVLDINLGEQKVYPVVDALVARGVHCVFATGNDAADVPFAYAAITRCEKPIEPTNLVQALAGTPSSSAWEQLVGTTYHMRDQLLSLVELAIANNNTLLAAKLCEALDVLDRSLN